MSVITVLGEINEDKLGVVLPHEHIYIDLRVFCDENQSMPQGDVLAEQKVDIKNLGLLHRNPYAMKDNAMLDDESIALDEILEYKKAGGDTIVDVTPVGIMRDPVLLRRASIASGINVIAGCGYYLNASHPAELEEKTVDEIAQEMLTDLTVGIDGTGIRAGVIGEIGTSEIIYPREKKVLIASAIAQKETGVGIMVHTFPWGTNGVEAVKILTQNGVPANKICICHVDVDINLDYIEEIIKMGAYVEFDNWGKEYYIDKKNRGVLGGIFARDTERVKAIVSLLDSGYASNLLISCDVCLKILLHRYGGWGYDHVLSNILPMMKEVGVTEQQINLMIRENPKAFLSKSSC